MNIIPNIEKEQVNQMPVGAFQGKIVVVDTPKLAEKAIAQLQKEQLLGFDTETRPSFSKHTHYKVSLMQIAAENICYLFRLNKIGFPPALEELLTCPSITKVGLSLKDDFYMLRKITNFNQSNFIDIQSIITSYGIKELSLQKIYAILFGEKISKAQRLTNWEADRLTEAQQLYAATDAWATRRIYLKLKTMTKND